MQQLDGAIAAAAGFLVSHQAAGGAWRDYPGMPLGASDGWISAYVGRALAQAAVQRRAPASHGAALRAARHLLRRRRFAAGFGYNKAAGPDADSTAHTLALLQQLGLQPAPQDVAWLLAHWRANGGCATYARRDAWGVAHTCVTPVAWLALPPAERAALAPAVHEFTLACRRADGSWPAYWWRSPHYATFWNSRALQVLEPGALAPPAAALLDGAHSAFELACTLGTSVLAGQPNHQLVQRLLALQAEDGSWPGAPNLRLTHPACFQPWLKAHGDCYTDRHHLMTTATALDVLALLAEQ